MKQRPKSSQAAIDGFTEIIDAQDEKGFEKYGVSLDQANDDDYDWKLMALEEAADLQKYLIMRIFELEKEVARLKAIISAINK